MDCCSGGRLDEGVVPATGPEETGEAVAEAVSAAQTRVASAGDLLVVHAALPDYVSWKGSTPTGCSVMTHYLLRQLSNENARAMPFAASLELVSFCVADHEVTFREKGGAVKEYKQGIHYESIGMRRYLLLQRIDPE